MTTVLIQGSHSTIELTPWLPEHWDVVDAITGHPLAEALASPRHNPRLHARIAALRPEIVLTDLIDERHGIVITRDGHWRLRSRADRGGLEFGTLPHLHLWALALEAYLGLLEGIGARMVVNDMGWATHDTNGRTTPGGRWYSRAVLPYLAEYDRLGVCVVSTRPIRAQVGCQAWEPDRASCRAVCANLAAWVDA